MTPRILAAALGALAALAPAGAAQVLEIGPGEVVTHHTALGPLVLDHLHVGAGGVLQGQGPLPLVVLVRGVAQVEGLIIASGHDAKDVAVLSTGQQPEVGGLGGPGGGAGGTGSYVTTGPTLAGGAGSGPAGFPRAGGLGGESSYGGERVGDSAPGSGGGGRFAPDQPVDPDPLHPGNQGLVATGGANGGPNGFGALSGEQPAKGGAPGVGPFVDGDRSNDFFGAKLDQATGRVILGELDRPTGGAGGGAGGNALSGPLRPAPMWSPSADEKGAGGGGGGGVLVLLAERLIIGAEGRIEADGGQGASNESTILFDHGGGASGGGSGGMILLEARLFDLSAASAGALSARGGGGGLGQPSGPAIHGGDGGPGVIQLHVDPRVPDALHLPAGTSIGSLSAPDAHLLLTLLRS